MNLRRQIDPDAIETAWALRALSYSYSDKKNYAGAIQSLEEALTIYRTEPDHAKRALLPHLLTDLSKHCAKVGDAEKAQAYGEEAAALREQLGR